MQILIFSAHAHTYTHAERNKLMHIRELLKKRFGAIISYSIVCVLSLKRKRINLPFLLHIFYKYITLPPLEIYF